MISGWLDPQDWKRVQDSVPVACVDLLPLQLAPDGSIARVGLIYRDTPHQAMRWCVVGGRLRRNESLAEAIGRQIRETLGTAVHFAVPPEPQPHYVSQYFTTRREVGLVDPRQHALTLNFNVPISGVPKAQGEAAGFDWFAPDRLPTPDEFGFEQDKVVAALLKAWNGQSQKPLRQVLFLCTGNYYRSRFAEELFNHRAVALGLPWRADSRALAIERGIFNVGPLSPHTAAALAERGIFVGEPVRPPRGLSEADLSASHHIVALKEAEHHPLMRQRFPQWADKVEYWHIHDLDQSTASEAIAEIEERVLALMSRLV